MHKKYANWRTIELTQIYVRIILRILDRLQIFTRMRSNWAISTKSSQICHFLWLEPDSSRPFFASLNVT